MWPRILYIKGKDVAMVQKECSECNSGNVLDVTEMVEKSECV